MPQCRMWQWSFSQFKKIVFTFTLCSSCNNLPTSWSFRKLYAAARMMGARTSPDAFTTLCRPSFDIIRTASFSSGVAEEMRRSLRESFTSASISSADES